MRALSYDAESEFDWQYKIVNAGDMDALPDEYYIDPCDHMLLEYMDDDNMLDITYN
jgi:hypothetical protein